MAHTLASRERARRAYEDFAAFYDDFTWDHEYDAWTATLETLAELHGLAGRRLFDIACGTGKSFLPFLARGYDVTACDISRAMLTQAARKAGDAVSLVETDMAELPALGRFDLVTCLDDALNYALDALTLGRAFEAAARNLRPGGIYVFDLNTLETYRSVFSATVESESGGRRFVWRGATRPDVGAGSLARATIDVVSEETPDPALPHRSEHIQRHHGRAVVEALLDRAALELAGVYGQFRDGRIDDELDEGRHTKAVYVARKPS
jgi:SAM-dependent methyltransferase